MPIFAGNAVGHDFILVPGVNNITGFDFCPVMALYEKGIKNTLQKLGIQAINKGYSETFLGRKRYYKRPDSYGSQKSLERKGRNTPIQSTCGDILKKALYYLYNDLQGHNAKIINLVHDEIVVEVNKEQAGAVKNIVERAMVRAGEDFIHTVPISV